MQNAFFYTLFIGTIIIGCKSIDNLEPNQTNTFLKFYSETDKMESKDLLVLDDGYLILSTYSATSTLLLKTDVQGNKIWADSLANFQGNSLAQTNDGYIIIGDSINTEAGTTFMQLIKTTKDNGIRTESVFIGTTGVEHGSAVTVTSTDQVISLGYTADSSGDSIILMSYDSKLVDVWPAPRKYLSELPANSIYDNNGLITWISYYANQSSMSITTTLHDTEGNESNPTLLNGQTLANTSGDLAKTPAGYSVVQTINSNGESKIGYSSLINGQISSETILTSGEFETGNYNGYTLTNTLNGMLIAATTDKHVGQGEEARTDQDLLLLEVDINGFIVLEGINQTFGGIGNEIPKRIRKTADGGYAILGTSTNSKGGQQTFLLKTNSKGELN